MLSCGELLIIAAFPKIGCREVILALKDLISINDLTAHEVGKIFANTDAIKLRPMEFREALLGRSVALIFEKPSLRTRVTFDLGATQMGALFAFWLPEFASWRTCVGKDMAQPRTRWIHRRSNLQSRT